jgi:formylglycine-generating enzyme required for sulfatase activity
MRDSLKLALVVGAALSTLSSLSMLAVSTGPDGSAIEAPAVVVLRPQPFHYRLADEFTRDGTPVNAPERTIRPDRALAIMIHQVTAAEYRRCVRDHACPIAPEVGEAFDRPAVKVSWLDAEAYAAWLSHRLDTRYRLPADEEWAFAAGSRFRNEIFPENYNVDPAQRWLARYELEADRDAAVEGEPRPIGSFGVNENGLVDLAGNVWEWTSTCFAHQILDRSETSAPIVNCGVRVAEGRHRAYMPDFIRDPRSGGCSVGVRPSNLGFRLVRENGPLESLRLLIWRLL